MDRNGEIDFPEFRHIFEDLKVDISEAKLRVYFQKCDLRNRGTLNYREFHTAMFTVNPINPKRSIRFAPGKYLSPHDIFSLFDTDKSQNIDRSEFSEMLRFMNYDIPLDKQEYHFCRFENVRRGDNERAGAN